jgi:8-amino-3,8-dideoxy-alpha-D-manno-octulosonate transaminase
MARIHELKAVCDKKGLILIEDACQSLGATFEGKAAGTFGQMGCYSFDAVKTITCGEGGAVVTDDTSLYFAAQAFADHGHDHIGSDRGLEDHPILGNNFRISELNAAVGLAQLRKLDAIIEKQRAHKNVIKRAFRGLPEIGFREIPDEAGDSATFFSFFLPTESTARGAAEKLKANGVDGCFYWYDNNWHYVRRWQHLKSLSSAAKLPAALLDPAPDYKNVRLPQSDDIIGRTISMQIKLSWTESELSQRIERMEKAIKESLHV